VRVLLITPRPPAPRLGGDRLRLHELVRFLGARHELVLVTLAEDRHDELAARSLQDRVSQLAVVRHPRAARLLRTAAGLARPRRPLQVSYFHADALVRAARRVGPVDVALGSLIRTAPAVLALGVPAVVDVQDSISLHYRRARPYLGAGWRALYGIEQPRVEAFERAVAREAAAVSMISKVDRDDLQRRCPDARIEVAGNGVDPQRFHPSEDVAPVPDRWVFLGNLRTLSNRDMVTHLARDVVPRLAASRPSAELRIVGTQPTDDVLRLHDGRGVVVVGPVDDPAEHLQRAWMSVCPMRFGAGVQNKVLESLAVGTPVVLTPMAAEPLGLRDGDGVLVRDGAAGIAEGCERLFADPQLRGRLSRAARDVVEQRFGWDDALAPLEALLREVAGA
jgi:glycosyltransferase involved in cell wall biosynthesis